MSCNCTSDACQLEIFYKDSKTVREGVQKSLNFQYLKLYSCKRDSDTLPPFLSNIIILYISANVGVCFKSNKQHTDKTTWQFPNISVSPVLCVLYECHTFYFIFLNTKHLQLADSVIKTILDIMTKNSTHETATQFPSVNRA